VRSIRTLPIALFALLGLASVATAQPRRIDPADEDETGGRPSHSVPQPTPVEAQPEPEATSEAEATPPPETTSTTSTTAHTPTAVAGPPPRAYIVSVASDDSLEAYAQRAGAAARHELRTLTTVDWHAADQLFLGYDDSALETIERARVRLDQGRQAYLNLDLQQAIELLTGAVADFDATATALEDPEDLGQALLFLGASYAFNGQNRDATRIFARLHVQMPHIVPDPNVFPPDVTTRFDAARPRDSASPSASIAIESDPPGIAYVDFVARGITPITVSGLIGGEHVVRVTRAGATPSVSPVTVRPRATESSSAFLVEEAHAQGLHDAVASIRDADASSAPSGSPVQLVADILGVERLAVIRVSPSDSADQITTALDVYDVATGRRLVHGSGTAPTGIGQLEDAVHRFVSGGMEAALTTRPQPVEEAHEVAPPVDVESPLTPPPPPPSHSIAEEWWFWTIIGGVVVVGTAIALGVYFGTQSPNIGQSPSGVVVLEF
jgi:hypothetical protein